MADNSLILWDARLSAVVPQSAHTVSEIAKYALQLRKRDVSQIVAAFESHHFEMASTFVWSKAMAALKKQLATLGPEFIGEMLQRPDIDELSDIATVVTDSEAISLAEDLGMVTATDALRLRHAHEIITHFAKADFLAEDDSDDVVEMTPEEALGCLRTCIQTVLGHPQLEVAQSFAAFRRRLEETSFDEDDEAIAALAASPYFYRKTTLSVLLALLKASSGAQLQHVTHNAVVAIPRLWPELRKPERWQAGQTYAELYAAGKKTAFVGLKKALELVGGFDYVPENLRSVTFTRAATDVLQAHDGMNNFYNEAGPMKVLASLGTTIPAPAFPLCMTAALSVWLGNSYGHAWSAEASARKLLDSVSKEQWLYYLDGCLPSDRRILFKLLDKKPCERWCTLVSGADVDPEGVKDRQVRRLLDASKSRSITNVGKIATSIYKGASVSN